MKRVVAVLCVVLALAGCSAEDRELKRGMVLRDKVLSAEAVSFQADITADYGDSIAGFSVACETDSQGNITFQVFYPDSISGITGSISDSGGRLTFDDTALYFELLTDDQLSPVSAPWIFMRALRSGYLRLAGMDGDYLRLTIDDSYDEDALNLDIWLDASDLPVRGEILYDGRRILSLDVANFTIR